MTRSSSFHPFSGSAQPPSLFPRRVEGVLCVIALIGSVRCGELTIVSESLMSLKAELIKLGEDCPELQEHIRPVLDKITRRTVSNVSTSKTVLGSKTRGRLLSGVLALMRAMYMHYQTAHWQTSGSDFYGDHLLFQRLYETLEEEIDMTAEKLIGLDGNEFVDLSFQLNWTKIYGEYLATESCLVKRSLQLERVFQSVLARSYELLDSIDVLTLGLDDFLMSLASSHESHLYLLQQRLK